VLHVLHGCSLEPGGLANDDHGEVFEPRNIHIHSDTFTVLWLNSKPKVTQAGSCRLKTFPWLNLVFEPMFGSGLAMAQCLT
jgi:hypothetical protein